MTKRVIWENDDPSYSDEAVRAVGGEHLIQRAWGDDDWDGKGCILTIDHRVLKWSYGTGPCCCSFAGLSSKEEIIQLMQEDIEEFSTPEQALTRFEEYISE